MGRHSAPAQDDEDVVADAGGDTLVETAAATYPTPVRPRPGRHSRPDDEVDVDEPPVTELVHTGPISLIESALAADIDVRAAPDPAAAAVPPEPVRIVAEAQTMVLEPVAIVDLTKTDAAGAPGVAEPATAEPEAEREPTAGLETQREPAREHKYAAGADLALLRTRGDVRARAVAALLLPFVLYTVAMVLLDKLGVYLIWVWIPAIVAGVAFGAILDVAHRAGVRTAETPD